MKKNNFNKKKDFNYQKLNFCHMKCSSKMFLFPKQDICASRQSDEVMKKKRKKILHCNSIFFSHELQPSCRELVHVQMCQEQIRL